ncbi:hypothetical protein [Brucella sp. 10RB9213]|uniref:hypothetical protein n=1 Tax=Brucella sp. 10RB9213 TaxID=1844039 RepID=UPI00189E80BD|nr:hypothetical protein [Brucella sp. 10RB9213]
MGTLDFRFRRTMSVIAPGTNIITGLCRLFKIVVFHLILPFMAPLPSSKNKKRPGFTPTFPLSQQSVPVHPWSKTGDKFIQR